MCSWGLGDLSRLMDGARYHKRPFSRVESEAQEYYHDSRRVGGRRC
jgi:hypothetical protein